MANEAMTTKNTTLTTPTKKPPRKPAPKPKHERPAIVPSLLLRLYGDDDEADARAAIRREAQAQFDAAVRKQNGHQPTPPTPEADKPHSRLNRALQGIKNAAPVQKADHAFQLFINGKTIPPDN